MLSEGSSLNAAYDLAAKPGWPHRRAMFGPLVAPPVLVMQGKESGIAEIEPEHVDGLVQVEFLMQDAQIHKTLGDWHERVAVAGRSNGQALANGLVVRRR